MMVAEGRSAADSVSRVWGIYGLILQWDRERIECARSRRQGWVRIERYRPEPPGVIRGHQAAGVLRCRGKFRRFRKGASRVATQKDGLQQRDET